MALEFALPEIGEGVVEGEIVEWHVASGDEVAVDQPILSVMTDKATVEIAASFAGVVEQLVGEPGDVVEVGSILLRYRTNGAAPTAKAQAPKNSGEAGANSGKTDPGSVREFPLPEIGEGVMEGEIVEWHVSPGDHVSHDSSVVSVLTDKATVEITAPVDGVIVETIGEPGDVVEVGKPIMKIRTAVSEGKQEPAPVPAAAKAQPSPKAEAPARSNGTRISPEDNPSISKFGIPLATPAVRKLAASQSLDLRTVRGTGPNHRITRADVEGALAAPRPAAAAGQPAASRPEPAPAAAPAPSGGERREKIRGMRKAILTSMSRSKRIIPHFTYVDEVEMDKLVEIRTNLKSVAEAQDIKLTYLPFIAKAVVFALKKYPILNASVDDEAGEIVYRHDYNLGIATATPSGLTVPVLKHADRKTVLEIATEIAELSERARHLKSTMDDITGGTFTITSLGRLGGLLSTPIVNHPEVAIMGIHNLQERAVVRDGQIVVRKMMNLALSFDHRVVDGDVGASFTQEVKSYLEEPGKLLLSMV